jgi:nucleoporin NUP42
MTKVKAKPGVTPYDSLLPPQYAALLPGSVVDAFKSQKFEFGKVPEWVPPVELR